MQDQLGRIIPDGCLTPDDIHNLSLTDKTLFQAITDPARARGFWHRHLPFPSVFLFDRAVRVYAHESDEKGAVLSYYVKSQDGHQVVCRRAVASGKPDILIAEEVKRCYDLWISFFVGDRLKTLDDVVHFHERYGKDFPDADYLKFAGNNQLHENAPPPVFLEIATVAHAVLNGVKRFRKGATLDDNSVDVMLNMALIPFIKKGYLNLDALFSIFYLLGKNIQPVMFNYIINIFVPMAERLNSTLDERDRRYVRDFIVQILQPEYLFHLYQEGPADLLLNNSFRSSDKLPPDEDVKDAMPMYYDCNELPGYSHQRFNASVCLDVTHRSSGALLVQLQCFTKMIQNGYLTFERLYAEYSVSAGDPFLMSYCTPPFLRALEEKLICFDVLEPCFFRDLPFFFQLENSGDVQVPRVLLEARDSFIDFLRILKKRNLQNDFEDFYAAPFFDLLKQFKKGQYASPFDVIDDFLQFEAGKSEEGREFPFFKAAKDGVFTTDSFLKTYLEFVEFIEQTLVKHMSAPELGPEARDLIVKSRPHYALMIRLFLFSFVRRLALSKVDTLKDALTSFQGAFEAFCAEVITPAFVTIITDRNFVKEFQEFYKYYRLSNSFVKTKVALVGYSIDKRQKFDGILSDLDALEYLVYLTEKGQKYSFDLLKDLMSRVHLFNRHVIELTSRYSFALPRNPMLISPRWDLDKQLALYSVISEAKSADTFVAITRQYYALMSSLFGDQIALNLVNTMIQEGQALQISAAIASGRWTMDQYSDFLLRVLQMSFLVRSRTYIVTSCIEINIVFCMKAFVGELFKLIMEDREIDFKEIESKIAERFSLN